MAPIREPELYEGPTFDGGTLMRAMSDGERVWSEVWSGPDRGWERGATVASVLKSPPASESKLREFGVPEHDWPPAWREEVEMSESNVARSDSGELMFWEGSTVLFRNRDGAWEPGPPPSADELMESWSWVEGPEGERLAAEAHASRKKP